MSSKNNKSALNRRKFLNLAGVAAASFTTNSLWAKDFTSGSESLKLIKNISGKKLSSRIINSPNWTNQTSMMKNNDLEIFEFIAR